jgi:Anti-sigma regulatory factor (Ser/Thr protein kinase)
MVRENRPEPGRGKMSNLSDRIVLSLPFKAEYVSVVRLTVSGIANRMGFDIETIEDIKVAVAEVCNKLVNSGCNADSSYNVSFEINKDKLVILFESDVKGWGSVFKEENDELGISIINAFMDNVEFYPDGTCILSMTKAFEGIFSDGK